MTDYDAPGSLEEASKAFCKFLRNNAYPEPVLWVEETDVLWDRHQIWVRPAQRTWDIACETYANGIKSGLGVSLYAFSSIEGMTIATVLVPEDEGAARRSLIPINGLKMSAATNSLPACKVASSLRWLILSVRHRRSSRLFRTTHLTCA
jgi:hypothetical protein